MEYWFHSVWSQLNALSWSDKKNKEHDSYERWNCGSQPAECCGTLGAICIYLGYLELLDIDVFTFKIDQINFRTRFDTRKCSSVIVVEGAAMTPYYSMPKVWNMFKTTGLERSEITNPFLGARGFGSIHSLINHYIT